MANIGGRQVIDATPGTTVTLTIDVSAPVIHARWVPAQATTINISGTPLDGTELIMIMTNDGVLGRLITFGTGLLSSGTLLGIISKKSIITFIADSGTFIEKSRSIGL